MVITVIVLDTPLRFTSAHEILAEKSFMGYLALSVESYMKLPDEVKESLVTARVFPMVCAFGRGAA